MFYASLAEAPRSRSWGSVSLYIYIWSPPPVDRPCPFKWVVVHGLSSDGWQSALPKSIQKFPKFSPLTFGISRNSKFSKIPQKFKQIQSFQNVRTYVLEKSRALALGILEILKFLEIVDFLEIPKFPKSSPLCFGAILSTRSGDFGNFENFGDFGIFGNVGNLGNFGLFGSFGIFCLLHGCVRSREIGLTPVNYTLCIDHPY